MDALSDLLQTIRLHTSTYFCSDFNTAWAMRIPADGNGVFHTLIDGQCWLEMDSLPAPIQLNTGDIVAFPTGGAHQISSRLDQAPLSANEVVDGILGGHNPFYRAPLESDDSDIDKKSSSDWATLMCGAFAYDSSMDHPFIRDLPCFIHIKAADTPELGWLRSLVQVVSVESRQQNPGASVVVDRLTEVLFIQLLRVHMQTHTDKNGYLQALHDPKIGKALNLIHADCKAELNVDTLAQASALSRSAFSERFTRLVGEAPKSYLQRWRFEHAKRTLRERRSTLLAIALDSGYSSEAAFSKAFKQHFGLSPGAYRKQSAGPD